MLSAPGLSNCALQLAGLLAEKKLLLAVAESCTGGMIGATITSLPGSSSYFCGGVISYSNKLKENLLNVPRNLLESCGAVSREVVAAMALGAQKLCNADCAIAVSGIAGPDGGTGQKPVGLVCIGIAVKENVTAYEKRFSGDRQSIREQTVTKSLQLLSDALLALK